MGHFCLAIVHRRAATTVSESVGGLPRLLRCSGRPLATSAPRNDSWADLPHTFISTTAQSTFHPVGKAPVMKRSLERILTTHAGSLARPPELVELINIKESAVPY